jgi:hypothetical protein
MTHEFGLGTDISVTLTRISHRGNGIGLPGVS